MKRLLEYLRKKFKKKENNLYKTKSFYDYSTSSTNDEDKSAILIGLNYPNSHYTLKGCINDVKNGKKFLTKKGYQCKLLEDKDISDEYNVLEALNELKDSVDKVVFFHYSGHGTQVRDNDGDEADGKDEAVYSKDGKIITDDEINEVLNEFPENKTLFLIFDCCHSGTIADLPYIATEHTFKLEFVKKHVKAKVICISGCQDPQTSADVTDKGVSYGALSATLYDILRKSDRKKKEITWRELYIQLVSEMKKKKYSQFPQLTASDPALFDEIVKF